MAIARAGIPGKGEGRQAQGRRGDILTEERWTQMALSAVDNTPEQFSVWLGEQSEQWGRSIKEAGVKAE